MTVLLADIKSSMELLVAQDVEEARRRIDPVLELMMEAVHCFEGIVNQVMGDGIMALFGAPVAQEDHALRACCAALRMQDRVLRYTREVEAGNSVPVQIRIGVASGEVLVRTIGSDVDLDYSAIGQTTHVAGRLEQMAEPGTILCTTATERLAEGFLRTKPLGLVPVRGLPEPIELAQLLGIEAGRMRFHAAVNRGLSPLVGREGEIEQLRADLVRARAGQGRAVALIGEAGAGKSRLVWELSRSEIGEGCLWLTGGAVSYGGHVPYLPVATMLRQHLEIADRDDDAQTRAKLSGTLRRLQVPADTVGPAILALLGMPPDDADWAALDPVQRRQRINDAVTLVLLAESRERPIALVLEDLHWSDHETLTLLDHLARQLAGAPCLIAVTARPETSLEHGRGPALREMRVEPLSSRSAAELLDALLGDDASLDPLKLLLVERAAGNPYFLEEMVRSLVESGTLAGAPGRRRLAEPLDRVRVAPSIQSVLAARIDRLPADAKHLLQTAAVLGTEIPLAVLAEVWDESAEVLHGCLTRLRESDFIASTSFYPDPRYTFRHPLIHEVAYGGLVHARRHALHARALEAIERLHPTRLSQHAERLAHHAYCSQVWDKAVEYSAEAGTKAAERSAYREAAAYLEQAIAALAHLPENQETLARAIDLRLALRGSLFPLGRFPRDLEHLTAAEPLASRLGDQSRLAWILAHMVRDLELLGHPERALELGTRALAVAEDVRDVSLQALVRAYLGLASQATGDYRVGAELLRASVGSLGDDGVYIAHGFPGPASVFVRAWLAWILTELGEFSEASVLADDAVRVATLADQPLSRAVAHYTRGSVHVGRGDMARALPHLEQAFELCRAWHLVAWLPRIAAALGNARGLSGRIDEGLALLESTLQPTKLSGFELRRPLEAGLLGFLAHAYLRVGRLDDAWRCATDAVALASAARERGHEAYAHRILGDIAAHREPPDVAGAEKHYQEALALATALGMRPLMAHCHLGQSDLFTRVGKSVSAAAERSAADVLLAAMGMSVS